MLQFKGKIHLNDHLIAVPSKNNVFGQLITVLRQISW